MRSGSAVAVGVGDEPVALAGGDAVEQALAVADLAPRALSLQPRESFGMAYQGRQVFTAIGAVAGRRGQQGIPGPAGGQAFQRIAGEVLSALRAVWEGPAGSVFSLDYRNSAAIYLLLGLTLTAADTGGAVNVQRSGPIDDSAWSWMPGPVWLGVDGALTQVPPVEGFCVLLGSAVSATRLILDIHQPIALG
nr:hypothetical protein [Pseudomonas mendocina]